MLTCLFASIGVLSLRFSEGNKAYNDATELVEQTAFDEAALSYWKAILSHSTEDDYTVMTFDA